MLTEYIIKAQILGSEAFERGLKCVPALDKKFQELLKSLQPDGTLRFSKLVEAWRCGWETTRGSAHITNSYESFKKQENAHAKRP